VKKQVFPILLVNFIGVLGYSIVIPLLIFIITDLGGNGFVYGVLGAMYPLFQFMGAPILGRMSDTIGRRLVLIISQTGTFIAWVLFVLALLMPKTELWAQQTSFTGTYVMTVPLLCVFLARILDGFTGGNISVANAYLSDISTDKDRSANFAKMATSSSVGLVIGPAVAGILASTVLGSLLPIMAAAGISLLAIFVISTRLTDTTSTEVNIGIHSSTIRHFLHLEHKECYQREEKKSVYPKIGWKSVLSVPDIPRLYAIYFLTYLAFSLFYSGLPIYASTSLRWTAGDLGIYLALSSLIMVVVQGPVLNRLNKRFASQTLIITGALLLSGSFFLLTIENDLGIYGANVLLSVGNGLMWPSFLSVLAEKGGKKIQGAIQGYGTSMGSLASMLGLVAGGVLFELFGTLVFFVSAFLFAIVLALALRNDLQST